MSETIKLFPSGEVRISDSIILGFVDPVIGVCVVRTSLKEINKRSLKKIVRKIGQTVDDIVEISKGDDGHIWITVEDTVECGHTEEEYKKNRMDTMSWIMNIVKTRTKCEFIDYEGEPIIDCPINSIEVTDKVIHRKGAIQVNIEQLGIIQGKFSKHIVKGYGNNKTHNSCSYKGENQKDLVDFRVELIPLVTINK